ncbi:MAG: ABC transporter ATP-binding protein [Lachnospiraceae bacterium]
MKKIFKNMLPYWYMLIAIFGLLIVQAFCDLSLPQYTSDIIDTGIQNGGVEHILPEKLPAQEYELAEMFMTQKEKNAWEDCYALSEDGDYYDCTVDSEKRLDELDEELLTPVVLTYRMANMNESDFKDLIGGVMAGNPQTAAAAEQIDELSVEEICQMLQVELHVFRAEDETGETDTYVDIRPLLQQMIASGQMTEEAVESSRDSMEEMISAIGSSTLKSMGVAYAISCDEAAGLDMEEIQTSYLWKTGGYMFLIAILMLAASVGVGYLASRVGAGVGRDLRGRIFKKVVGFSNAEMDRFSTASLITRSTNDVQQIQMVTAVMLRMVLYAPILGIGGIFKVMQTGAHMEWIIALAVLMIVGFVLLLVSIAMPKFKIMQTLVDAVNLVSREILTGLSVIRAFGREKTEEKRFDKANTDLMKTQLFTNRVMTFMMPGMTLIMYGVTVLIVWVSAQKIDAGNLQVGAMTAFITYSMQIVMAFLMLTAMSIMLPRAGVAAERIDEVLKTEVTIKDAENPRPLDTHRQVLTFDHVNFRYPGADEDVLHDIDFTAEPGKTTAIIGSTGCGKSTLVNLIPRFFDVTGGRILLDGRDIREIGLHELRDRIGFVPQKGVLFSGTIASNLRFGNSEASDEEIREAAEIAQASEFIEEKYEKYNSNIAQGGSNVSGGQKQRLAIARAIAKNPGIYVFDDSFSALDMKTDAKLRQALAPKISNSTVLIVAQRVSTILHADQILVLDEGRIVGKGTHEELLRNCEVYQQIAKSQLSAAELGLNESEGGVGHE